MKRQNQFLIILFCFFFVFSSLFTKPALANAPQINAKAAVLLDVTEERTLLIQNHLEPMAPGGLTKILTALVALDYIEPNDIIEVGEEISYVPWDSLLTGHFKGEQISGEVLYKGLILATGNETATIAASETMKRVEENPDLDYAVAERAFVRLMNEKAKELGAESTKMINVHGYPHPYHQVSAMDMAKICEEALKNPLLAEIFNETYIEVYSDGKREKNEHNKLYKWETANELLLQGDNFYPYATGIKTGFTNQGGYAVAASATKDDRTLVAVVMGAEEDTRFTDIINMFKYGFSNYSYHDIISKEEPVDKLKIDKPRLGEDEYLDVLVKEPFTSLMTKDEKEKITVDITYDDEIFMIDEEESTDEKTVYLDTLDLPIKKGEVLGEIKYIYDGDIVFETEVISSREVLKRTFNSDIDFYIHWIKTTIFPKKYMPFWIIGLSLLGYLLFRYIRRRRKEKAYWDMF